MRRSLRARRTPPTRTLALAESQRVKLTISDTAMGRYPQDLQFLEWARAEVAAVPNIPSLEEVQAIMSKIPGSLADDFAAERDE